MKTAEPNGSRRTTHCLPFPDDAYSSSSPDAVTVSQMESGALTDKNAGYGCVWLESKSLIMS